MGKPTICICENKDTDQLRSNCEADLRLCFRYTDTAIKSGFVSDLVWNSNCWFPHANTHILSPYFYCVQILLTQLLIFPAASLLFFSLHEVASSDLLTEIISKFNYIKLFMNQLKIS